MTLDRILDNAIDLFAKAGFSGVSMRKIAQQAGITQAAIYHHFDSKEALYLAAIKKVFRAQTGDVLDSLEFVANPVDRLEALVKIVMQRMNEEPQLRQIYVRELLEGNDTRLRLIAEQVFAPIYGVLEKLMKQLAPRMDATLMLISITGLVFHHLEAKKIVRFLPGLNSEQENVATIAHHITQLVTQGAH